jgi:hypothetical protein
MSDIVERLREYAEEWQIDRSIVDRAADEIIRLRALVESSVVLAQPGALTVNCVRGTVSCQEAERLRARVEVLETIRAAAQALIDYEDSDTYDPAGKGWEYWEENLRAALEAKP